MRKNTLLVLLPLCVCTIPAFADNNIDKPDDKWRGFINAGVSFASGNTTSRSGNLSAEATKATDHNKLHGYLTGLYGIQRDANGNDQETANLIRGGIKYDYDIDPKVYSFTSLDLEHDKLQRLDLRSVFGVGLGRHVIKTPATTFNVFTGVTYNREAFFDDTRNTIELLFGEESNHTISPSASFNQRLALYPNVKEHGEYRAQFDAALKLTVTEKIGVQLTLSDRYQSNPLPGIRKNDALFLASVSYKFGPK